MRYLIALGCLVLGIFIGAKWERPSAFLFLRNPPPTDPACAPRFRHWTNGVEDDPSRTRMPAGVSEEPA